MEFRKMRRIRQQLSEAEVIEILERGKEGVLGVNGDEGYPYTVPVNYVYGDGKIFFHGAKSGHKFDSMKANDKVSFCVIDKDDVVGDELTTYFSSVIAFGRVRILEEKDEIIEVAKKIGLRFTDNKEKVHMSAEKEFPALACFELNIEHVTGKEGMGLLRQRNK